ncbi:MAG: restriction endonuclease subunit S, partial [Dehalococcoidia bacterium]|nr:restriction endonuclease subunit S [Dehalococcoidia bacterium]
MSFATKEVTLPEICELVTDGTHDSPKLQPSGIPFIKGKHISTGRIDFTDCDYITEQDHLKCVQRVKPQTNDVLFSNIGSVGDAARVLDDNEFSIKNVALFRPNPEKVDPLFFYYLVKSRYFKGHFLNVRSGSAQPFISLENIRSLRFNYLKDKIAQQHIGHVLSAYDDLIENNRRRIQLLEQSARVLYKEWFVHLRFPGHEHVKIKDGIPDGWDKKQVRDVLAKVNRPRKIKKADFLDDGPIPCVDQSRDFIGGYTTDDESIVDEGKPIIVFGDHTRILKFVDFPFACGADGTQLIVANEAAMSQEYLY